MMDMPEEKNTFIHVNRAISRSAEERAAERGRTRRECDTVRGAWRGGSDGVN